MQQSGGVEGLSFVALAHSTGTHKVLHQPTIMVDEEVLTEALQGLLYAFVPNRVGELDHRRYQWGRRGHKDLGAPEHQAVHQSPRIAAVSNHRVAERPEVGVVLEFLPEHVVELKRRTTERAQNCVGRITGGHCVTAT